MCRGAMCACAQLCMHAHVPDVVSSNWARERCSSCHHRVRQGAQLQLFVACPKCNRWCRWLQVVGGGRMALCSSAYLCCRRGFACSGGNSDWLLSPRSEGANWLGWHCEHAIKQNFRKVIHVLPLVGTLALPGQPMAVASPHPFPSQQWGRVSRACAGGIGLGGVDRTPTPSPRSRALAARQPPPPAPPHRTYMPPPALLPRPAHWQGHHSVPACAGGQAASVHPAWLAACLPASMAGSRLLVLSRPVMGLALLHVGHARCSSVCWALSPGRRQCR